MERLRQWLLRFRDDPVLFVGKVFDASLSPQQEAIFREVAKPGSRVAVASGHGTGKTALLAIVAWWFLFCFPNARVPCTAPTANQLRRILWPEMQLWRGRMRDWWKAQTNWEAETISIKGREETQFAVARTASPGNPDALQGFHAQNLLFLIDEAAGVDERIFNAARGALSTKGARLLMTANPTRLSGYFYGAFHKSRDHWTRFHLSSLDSPFATKEYAQEIADEFGSDSDMYRIRVLGQFPRAGVNQMIPLEWVEAAMARTLPQGAVAHAPKILGVDVALEGDDRAAIVLRQGVWGRILFKGRHLKTGELADRVARHEDEEGTDATFIDKTGNGVGVVHALEASGRSPIGINFGGRPMDPERFVYKRDEMWWTMRKWFEDDVAVAQSDELRDDLTGPEYQTTPGGKIQLESKKAMKARGLASPDLGDALALTFAMPVYPKRRAPAAGRARQEYNPYDWMERD